MKFSERWLRAYVDPAISTADLADRLTMAGLEVESVQALAPPFTGVLVGQIVSFSRHPDADRLNVCMVDAGERNPDGSPALRQIVCGAPNVALAMKVPCAIPGAQLPGGMTISEARMRGVTSQGMLCSSRELGMSSDHAGLLELDGTLANGSDLRLALSLDDTVFELKLTPNRADCLSVVGVARELAALTGLPLQKPHCVPVLPTIADRLPVRIEAPDLCGRFAGRVIRGVNAGARTPDWIKTRLESAGQRSISVLVDLSNYVMLELGRPTHVFDLAKLDHPEQGLVVRWGQVGETLELLNGQRVALDTEVGVIASATGPESLAGIMGGQSVAVSSATTDIYVEAAFWWPKAIAGRARRYHFATEAAHRFERGVDAQTTVTDLEYLCALIVQVCGGQAGPIDDQILAMPERKPVTMRLARANRILGLNLSTQDCAEVFARLGFEFSTDADALTVVPPSWRFDLSIEEDLIEEVARIRGFSSLPVGAPLAPTRMAAVPGDRRSAFEIKRRLAARDFQEVVNFSFVSSQTHAKIGCLGPKVKPIRLLNPIAENLDVMRTSLLAGLLETLRANLNRSATRIRIFEAGRVFLPAPEQSSGPLQVRGIHQPQRIAALAYGDATDPQWGQATRRADFFDLKGDLEAMAAPLELEFIRFQADELEGVEALHPGRCARIACAGQTLGWIGELHPRVASEFDLSAAPVAFELELTPLLALPALTIAEPSKFPPVMRDLAFIVDAGMTAGKLGEVLEAAVNQALPGLLQQFWPFDEYRGKGLESNEKSLAFRFIFQDNSRTLNDDEIESAMRLAIAQAGDYCGARLR